MCPIHRYKVGTLFAVFLAFVVLPGRAAPLTLEQALALADQSHPLLQAGSAEIDAARAGIVTARAYPNPEAGAMAGRQTFRVPGNVAGFVQSYSFSQPLELGSLRPARIELAERGRESSEVAQAGTRLWVLSSVRRAFFQVLRKQGEIVILRESLRLVEDFRNRIQVLVDVGEVGRLELIRAEAEVATARTAANSAQLQQVSALAQLRAAVGATLDPVVELSGALDPPVRLPPLEELRDQALDRHPAIALTRAEVRRSESRLAYEMAQRRPQPSLQVQVDYPPDVPIYRAGIAIPLPLWNRREGPIAEAVARRRQAEAFARNRRIEILAGLESAYERYGVATQQLAAFEQGLLREAEEALRAAEAAYRLGERGILEVLDAQRVLRGVRIDFLNAQFDRQAALVDLDELRAVEPRKGTP
jgi:cobalt-zinc-cadmium efflux system outer membrane protein